MLIKIFLFIFLFTATLAFGQNNAGLYFIPDYSFKGSALTGWSPLGPVKWTAQNGEISAIATATGGLLQMNKSYQDAAMQLSFKSSATDEAGVVFRLEKTSKGDSLKGILVSVKDSVATAWSAVFDLQGKLIKRERMRTAGGIVRVAPPPPAATQNTNNPNANRNFTPPAGPTDITLKRPNTRFRPNEWNQLELYADADIVRGFLNDAGGLTGAIEEGTDGFGPIALYAAGTGTVQFKEIVLKDIGVRTTPLEQSSARFRVQRISDMYYSRGSTTGDYNKDGFIDVAAGPLIYYGPDFTKSKDIFIAVTTSPSTNFSATNCMYTFDFNNDGWPDIFIGPSVGTVYINPKGESRRWKKYTVIPAMQTELVFFDDIDKDGKPEVIYGADGTLRFAKADPSDPTKPWIVTNVSERGYSNAHGLGAGDINGDGRRDIVNPFGWWEQPATGATSSPWKYHPADLARYGHRATTAGGALMGVYDVNGDKMNDVVTSLNAHGFGLAWFEQKKDAAGNISFVQHIISDDYSTASTNAGGVTFSQIHGTAFGDIDGDGITDLIAGKRFWAHLDSYLDPDPNSAPVIYYYRTVRDPKAPGGAKFVPELIHNRSGVGLNTNVVDLDKNGKPDIITSNEHGTFIFWNKGK